MYVATFKRKLLTGKYKVNLGYPAVDQRRNRDEVYDKSFEDDQPNKYYLLLDYSTDFVEHYWQELLTFIDKRPLLQDDKLTYFTSLWSCQLYLIVEVDKKNNLTIIGFNTLSDSSAPVKPLITIQLTAQQITKIYESLEFDIQRLNSQHGHFKRFDFDIIGQTRSVDQLESALYSTVKARRVKDLDNPSPNKNDYSLAVAQSVQHGQRRLQLKSSLENSFKNIYEQEYYRLLIHYLYNHLSLSWQGEHLIPSWDPHTEPHFRKIFDITSADLEKPAKYAYRVPYGPRKLASTLGQIMTDQVPTFHFKMLLLDQVQFRGYCTYYYNGQARQFYHIYPVFELTPEDKFTNLDSRRLLCQLPLPIKDHVDFKTETTDFSQYYQPKLTSDYTNLQPKFNFGLNHLLAQLSTNKHEPIWAQYHQYLEFDYFQMPLIHYVNHQFVYYAFKDEEIKAYHHDLE